MYSKFLSGAGLLEIIAPAPEKDPVVTSKVEVSRKPGIIVELSTFGLKSITFFNSTIPRTDESNVGISSSATPASCR